MSGQTDRRTGAWPKRRSRMLRITHPAIRLSLCLMLAACRPSDRRLLMLDLALSDPALLEGTARPWADAGYHVLYRRYYPHLTRGDLNAYRTLLLLGGREPERASDRLTAGDLGVLAEWVGRGGVVVFGYAGDGEGFFDRWVMNRWLAWQGTGIVVGDYLVRDTTTAPAGAFEPQPPVAPVRSSPLRGIGTQTFPGGRNHVLVTADEDQVLARVGPAAYVRPSPRVVEPRPSAAVLAASRVGRGLVVVGSRHLLASFGPDLRPGAWPPGATRDGARRFLVALARWSRRPAEWSGIPPARGSAPLSLLASPLPVRPRAPPLQPPDGADTVALPLPGPPAPGESPLRLPPWAARDGMRVLWGRLVAAERFESADARARELDAVVGFVEAAGLNAFASAASLVVLRDSARAEPWEREYATAAWRQLAARLQTTNARWAPVIPLDLARIPSDSLARGLRGDTLAAPCALDHRLWDDKIAPAARAVARLAAERADLIAAAVLDLEPARGAYTMGHDYCDATYRVALRALGRDSGWIARFSDLPIGARYDALLEAGALGEYYDALERLVAERAARVRSEARRIAPELRFAFRSDAAPADWFSLGLLAGFAGRGPPVLLWTRESRGGAMSAAYQQRGIPVLHAVGLAPAAVAPADWPRLRTAAFERNRGFWIAGDDGAAVAYGDSLARLIRRLRPDR